MKPLPRLYQRGALLIAAIVLIVIIGALVTAMSFLSVSNTTASASHMISANALFAANSGLERALYQFSKLGTVCASLTNTNVAVSAATGAGTFTTSGTVYPLAATTATLSGAITNVATNIPVTVSVGVFANYAPHGRIRIENEELDYESTTTSATAACGTPPCFIADGRGTNGTAAAAHASAVAVFQDNQCLIRSTGTSGAAQRVMEATVK